MLTLLALKMQDGPGEAGRQLPTLEKAGNGLPPEPLERTSYQHLDFGHWIRMQTCGLRNSEKMTTVVLGHRVCRSLLQRPGAGPAPQLHVHFQMVPWTQPPSPVGSRCRTCAHTW